MTQQKQWTDSYGDNYFDYRDRVSLGSRPAEETYRFDAETEECLEKTQVEAGIWKRQLERVFVFPPELKAKVFFVLDAKFAVKKLSL